MDAWQTSVEKRFDRIENRFDRLEGKLDLTLSALSDVRVPLAGVSTKESERNWSIGIVIAIIAAALAMGGVLLQSSSYQLSAFQAGLSAVQSTARPNQ
jgi:hypothetical protein